MTIKESLIKEITRLDEGQLQELEDFLSFLKFRSRMRRPTAISEEQIARLYSESGEEDRVMAEQGIEDYAIGLAKEEKL